MIRIVVALKQVRNSTLQKQVKILQLPVSRFILATPAIGNSRHISADYGSAEPKI